MRIDICITFFYNFCEIFFFLYLQVNSKVNHQLSGSPVDHFHIPLDLSHK